MLIEKKDLLIHLIQSGSLKTPAYIEAFRKVDRVDFVMAELKTLAYHDSALPIGFGQSISQPFTVAFMLELLQPKKGELILDLGTGAGWTAGLLAEIVGVKGKIYTVDIIPELMNTARENLKKYSFNNIVFKKSGTRLGLPEFSPFHKILVSAEADHLPDTLVNQLAVGGTAVLPVSGSLVKVDKISDTNIEVRAFPGFAFVRLQY